MASRRAPHLASLSVILLSQGDRSALERALASVAGRCRRMEAEIIVVRASLFDDTTTLTAAYPSVSFLDAPDGSSDAEMREIGMNYASGDIVALRMDGAVGDGLWLEAFDSTVGCLEESTPPVETEIPVTTVADDALAMQERRKGRAYSVPSTSLPIKRDRRADIPAWTAVPGQPSDREGLPAPIAKER